MNKTQTLDKTDAQHSPATTLSAFVNNSPQSHLIAQDTADTILEEAHQPPSPLQLIVLQFTTLRQIPGLDENGLLLTSRILLRLVLILRALQFHLAFRRLAILLLALLLLLCRGFVSALSGGALFPLFLAAGCFLILRRGGLRLHVRLEFVDVGRDEVGVFLRAA